MFPGLPDTAAGWDQGYLGPGRRCPVVGDAAPSGGLRVGQTHSPDEAGGHVVPSPAGAVRRFCHCGQRGRSKADAAVHGESVLSVKGDAVDARTPYR